MLLIGPMDHLRYMSVSQLIFSLAKRSQVPKFFALKCINTKWIYSGGEVRQYSFNSKTKKKKFFSFGFPMYHLIPSSEQNEIINANEENLKCTLQKIKAETPVGNKESLITYQALITT